MNGYLLRFCLLLSFSFLLACSSSSSSSEDTDDDDDADGTAATSAEDLATFVRWSGHAWDDLAAMLDSSKSIDLDFPVECSGGGTIDLEGAEIALNDCIETSGGTTYLSRGTYTVTESGSLTSHEWEQDVMVDENADSEFATDEASFSSTGSISFNTDDDLVAYDFSATFAGETIRLTGIVSDNAGGLTSDVTFSVLLDGEAWQDGSFDDTDLDNLTDADVDEACTDDDDAQCDTLECSGDFECQIFAEDDQTDEFETGNTECSAGCCALAEEASACPGSSPCTGIFSCQLFADDDATDEFETDNVECGDDGCCAVTD